MTERVIDQRRKSQLFLENIVPVTVTYNEFVKKKLKPGKYLTTKTGIIKIVGMLISLLGFSFFIADYECEDTSRWYPYLLPISLGTTLFVQLTLFLIFAFGATINKPGFWIYLDMTLVVVLSIISLISSILTDKDCTRQSSLTKICGPVCMTGTVILIVSCGSIFLMYRFNEALLDRQENQLEPSSSEEPENTARKSIFA